MLSKLYQLIDLIWQKVSNLVFVRFDFDFLEDRVLRQPNAGNLVFALTHGGIIEWLILSSWCRKNGLGAILVSNRKKILLFSKPLIFLQVLFLKRSLSDVFLSNEPGPRLIFCTTGERKELFKPTKVESLIANLYDEEKRSATGRIYSFVPVFICWRKHLRGSNRKLGEYFFGLSSNPNIIGKIWYLFRKRKDSTVRALSPISFAVKDGVEFSDGLDDVDSNKMGRLIRRKIIVEVAQEQRIVLGPRYFSPLFIKESIMRDSQIQSLIDQISHEQQIDRKKVMGEAYGFLTEISANYTFRFIEVMYVVLTWLFKRIFEDLVVDKNQIQSLRETLKTKSVIFVSCHRSHLDYLVVPEVLFLEDIVTPHIAAGVNLSFWPVGSFLRMGGAFFIRRTFRGEPLYALCLQKYIEWLIKNRVNIKFFIEGTRSRTGKMLPPAYGLLKMVLQPFEDKQVEDIALVPVSISYDEVLEEGAYSRELVGGQKEKESAGGLIRSRKLFGRNIGKVYVRFASALSLKTESALETNVELDQTLFLQKLAFHLCKSINDVTPVTPKSILASVLIAHENDACSLEDILRASESLARWVSFSSHELSVSNTGDDFKRAIETGVKKLISKQTVMGLDETPVRYRLEDRQRINMIFYKNNAIHCFVLPSIALLSAFRAVSGGLGQSDTFFDKIQNNALELRNLFKFEFFFSPSVQFISELKTTLSYFVPGKEIGEITVEDFLTGIESSFDRVDDASVLIRLNRDIIESYLIAFDMIRRNTGSQHEYKFLLQQMVKEGVEHVENDGGFLPECISTQNFSNALKLLENMSLIKTDKEKDLHLVEILKWSESGEQALTELKDFQLICKTPLKMLLN